MKRRVLTLAAALSIALTSAIVRPEPIRANIGYCSGFYGITVYEAFNYGGASRTFCANILHAISIPNLHATGNWGNVISSVRTRNSAGGLHRIVLYDGTSYSGTFVAIYGNVDIANMQTDSRITRYVVGGFNNRAESMRTRIS